MDDFEIIPSVSEPEDINILLLGESGVGKSTFINSCFNYLKYATLKDALDNELEVLIPAKFDVIDEEYECKEVYVGTNDDNNENLEAGKAATQDVKVYIFPVELEGKKYNVRLLDTPGMGDERGSQQDEKNCELILAYLTQLKKVHAFCLLMKPGNTRTDTFMKYNMVQILSRLDATATANIIFSFTNTRGENFTPGKTMTPLKVIINDIKKSDNISIPISRANMFCFDNETFRYLAAVKREVKLEHHFSVTESSWVASWGEFWRMLHYIRSLPPHDLKRTISINDAKAMASQLAGPATEIVKLIDDNVRALEQHRKELSQARNTKEELAKKMYTPRIEIKITELDSPNTVCTSSGCTREYEVNGIRKVHYKSKCCQGNGSGCLASRFSMRFCDAFTLGRGCKKCGHERNYHRYLAYETTVFESKIDESMAPAVESHEELVKAKETFLKNLEKLQDEYEYERQYILDSCAIFDYYLEKNCMMTAGNTIKEYLNCEIMREKAFAKDKNDQTMEQLYVLLADYERAKQNTGESFSADQNFTPEEIQERKEGLLKLTHFGDRIQILFELHQSSFNKDFKKREKQVKCKQGYFSSFKNAAAAIKTKINSYL